MKPSTPVPDTSELAINPETVCYLILKARQYELKDEEVTSDIESRANEDPAASVYESTPDDPVEQELISTISDLNIDEQVDLVALAWLGRDGNGPDDWQETRIEAARSHNENTPTYLLGMPLIADYLEEGLSQLGFSCEDFDKKHL